MAGFDLPQSLSAESWNSKAAGLDKSKSAARTTLGNDLKMLQNQTRLVRWALLDVDKLVSAKEMEDRLKEIDAEKKSALDKLGKQLASIVKSADACNGKDIDKKAAEAIKAIKADAGGQKSAMEAKFNAALAALTQKLKTAPKPAAKTPAPPVATTGAAAKKAVGMAKTYRKLALEAIMKARTKPTMKPSRFMVAEFKKSVLFYMGMKYDKAKTTEVLKAMNPGDTFVRTYVDPNSKVIWEKGAVTLVSNRIQPKFATRMTKSSKLILGKTMKIRMRTETGEADEPDGAGVEEMSEAELNAELARMTGDPEVESDEDDVSADTIDDDDDAAPAAKTPAKTAVAVPPVSPALVSATRKWATTRSSAKAEIDGLFAEIGRLYGSGQEAQLAAARKTLDGCMEALAKLDKELAALIATKDKDERTKKIARARTTADQLIEFVRSNKVMANLDKNEVREISAAAKLSSSLAEIKAALA